MNEHRKERASGRFRTITEFLDPARYTQMMAEVNQRLQQIAGLKRVLIPSARSGDLKSGADRQAVPLPEIRPCFEIHCQDGPCDRVKTSGTEVLCIIARNPYTNVTLQDLTIVQFTITDEDGNPPPTRPDGSPTVEIIPAEAIYFGDLPPSTLTRPSTVRREVTLRSRRAARGDYLFDLRYRFSVKFVLPEKDQFRFPLIPS